MSAALALVQFVNILRRLGVRVSMAETMDAYNALNFIDVFDKNQFKYTLMAMLVKNQRDRLIFNRAFELFFTPSKLKEERLKQYLQQREKEERVLCAAARDLEQMLLPWQDSIPEKYCLTPENIKTFAQMPFKERERLKKIIAQMRGNPVNNPGELIAQVLQSSLNYWRYYMLKRQMDNNINDLEFKSAGDDRLDEIIQEVYFYRNSNERILYEDMQNISDEQLTKMTALINRLSAKLATHLSRRYKKSNRAQIIDMRRTIRENIRHGGMPLKLRYRSRSSHRLKVILICDVSASMACYARFVIQFIYGLSSALKNIESFVFSENLERITHYFEYWRDFAQTMAGVINESKQWGRTTNFYVSLQTFQSFYQKLLGQDVILIIVSDTKTVAWERAAVELAEISKKVRDTIWLNPVPRSQWPYLPAVRAFQEQARMFECYSLFHLEQVLYKEMLR